MARAEQDLADAELGAALAARSLETLSGLSPAAGATPSPKTISIAKAPSAIGSPWPAARPVSARPRSWREASRAEPQGREPGAVADAGRLGARAHHQRHRLQRQEQRYTLQLVLSWRLDYGTLASSDAQAAALEVQRVRVERTRRAAEDAAFEAFKRVDAGIAKSRAARARGRGQNARPQRCRSSATRAGVATQLDVTQAQRDAFLASAAKIQADADLAFARASLRLAAGIPVSDKRPR